MDKPTKDESGIIESWTPTQLMQLLQSFGKRHSLHKEQNYHKHVSSIAKRRKKKLRKISSASRKYNYRRAKIS